MGKHFSRPGTAVVLSLLSPAVFAQQEDLRTMIVGKLPVYALIAIVIAVIVSVYFMRLRDRRRTPLSRVFRELDATHFVGPDTSVATCVRTMTAEQIGALIVMEGERLIGIFTERDALNKVLATGLDPIGTKVSDVMTKDPHCIPPSTTVGEAMELVTGRRFRHLPIVENGKVLALVSSGDLTHWLVKGQKGNV